ncbi:glycosyltransferase [Sphingomonas bacterium]|uniref:glycosyltransferase n=1 Tax=Sphingomonas bacterium TaxID=1895847 RepID=UPI001575F85D|nr:glycosyltransferase [Sphingomonas bacterium]
MTCPIGYFVHHQGRGHAERAAAIVNALSPDRPVTIFSARTDIFPPLRPNVVVQAIPSLFEAPADLIARPVLAVARTPSTLHCAPLGWASITRAVASISRWFDAVRPALFVTDVSAELAQLARIASIPCVPVLQHGDRRDPGHMAAYESAVGILAPYAPALEQADRPDWMRRKTYYAPGLGVPTFVCTRQEARETLGLAQDADIVLVVSGGGGTGTPAAPLTIGARADPDALWLTIGMVEHQWHETSPGNLRHLGWVDDPATHIAAADRIVSSAGDTTVHMIAAAGRPWIVIPEWRYFDEQLWKARLLATAGAAVALEHWPSHVGSWTDAWARAIALDLAAQHALVDPFAADHCAAWLEALADSVAADPACSPVQGSR